MREFVVVLGPYYIPREILLGVMFQNVLLQKIETLYNASKQTGIFGAHCTQQDHTIHNTIKTR